MTRKKQNGRGGARPGSGPKPRPRAELRRNRVILLLTDAEYAELEKVSRGEPVNVFARSLVLRYMVRRRKK